MLTKRQYQLLMLIEKRLREDGVSPSFEEMKESIGLKSKSGIHRLISGLEERGFVCRIGPELWRFCACRIIRGNVRSCRPRICSTDRRLGLFRV